MKTTNFILLLMLTIALTNNVSSQTTSRLNVCVADNEITLDSTYGYWNGLGVGANKFYPMIAGVGTHILTGTKVSPTGDVTEKTMLVCVHPLPNVFIEPIPMLKTTSSPVELAAIPKGGVFEGKGIVNGNRFDPAIAGVGVCPIMYTYTSKDGCSGYSLFYVTIEQ